MARARKTDESFKAYRKRQNEDNKWQNQRCRSGHLIWNSADGPYERAKHGEIGTLRR
jgi:hypothetical protein